MIMKNILYIFLLLTQVLFAQGSFKNANEMYQKGDYNGAIRSYESILDAKQESAEVYFNLGNCYYKLNKVAPAIYNYEKALTLKPNDKDILNNLNFAKKLTIDEIKEVPKVGFEKLVRDFTATYHYNTWAWISVVLAVLFLLFFLGYYFSALTLSKRIFFIGMFVVLLAILISVSSAIFERNHYNSERPAIIFKEMVSVKSEPKASSSEVLELHEGTKVYVLESFDGWDKIQLTDGTEGWLEKSDLKEVK